MHFMWTVISPCVIKYTTGSEAPLSRSSGAPRAAESNLVVKEKREMYG